MNAVDFLEKTYPIGSRWWVPASYHTCHEETDLVAIGGCLVAAVVNHTVGAGLRRNADAGIVIKFDDGYTMEIVSSYYLPDRRAE